MHRNYPYNFSKFSYLRVYNTSFKEFKTKLGYKLYRFYARFKDIPFGNVHHILIEYENGGRFAPIDEILVNCNPSASRSIHIDDVESVIWFRSFDYENDVWHI